MLAGPIAFSTVTVFCAKLPEQETVEVEKVVLELPLLDRKPPHVGSVGAGHGGGEGHCWQGVDGGLQIWPYAAALASAHAAPRTIESLTVAGRLISVPSRRLA